MWETKCGKRFRAPGVCDNRGMVEWRCVMGMAMETATSYPFAQEFITDANGEIQKVILNIADYRALLEALEDEGLYRLMAEVRDETPLGRARALRELKQP